MNRYYGQHMRIMSCVVVLLFVAACGNEAFLPTGMDADLAMISPAVLTTPCSFSFSGTLMFGQRAKCSTADLDLSTKVITPWWHLGLSVCDGYRAENGEIIYVDGATREMIIIDRMGHDSVVPADCDLSWGPLTRCASPSLSSDGTLYAYNRSFFGGFAVHSRAGAKLAQINGVDVNPYDRPTFTPDKALVFADRAKGLSILDPPYTGTPRLLNNNPRQLGAMREAVSPSVSPDGKMILFARQTTGFLGVWMIKIDGSGLTKLALPDTANAPTWAPDGSGFTYFDGTGGKIVAVSLSHSCSTEYYSMDGAYKPTTWR